MAFWVLCPSWVESQIQAWGNGNSTSDTISAPPPHFPPPCPCLRQQEAPDLFQWLCSDSLKLCCPAGTFGPSCLREFLSCSWGWEGTAKSRYPVLALSLASCVNSGYSDNFSGPQFLPTSQGWGDGQISGERLGESTGATLSQMQYGYHHVLKK